MVPTTCRFECRACDAPDCSHESVCWDAILCYTAHVRDVDSVEMKSKGCASTVSQVPTFHKQCFGIRTLG